MPCTASVRWAYTIGSACACLRTALVKSHHDFATFDTLFARFFSARRRKRRRTPHQSGGSSDPSQHSTAHTNGHLARPLQRPCSFLPRLLQQRSVLTRKKHLSRSTTVWWPNHWRRSLTSSRPGSSNSTAPPAASPPRRILPITPLPLSALTVIFHRLNSLTCTAPQNVSPPAC